MQSTQHAPLTSRIGQILNSLPFYTQEELAAKPEPMKLFGKDFAIRQRTLSDGGRPFEHLTGSDISTASFLATARPNHRLDNLLIDSPANKALAARAFKPAEHYDNTPPACNIESGYLTMPDWEMFPLDKTKFGDAQPTVDHSLTHDVAFEFTAEELMEEYMEAQNVTVADKAVVDVLQIEDTFVHQLISPACLVTQAVTLLRLLEDDIRMMESVRTMVIGDVLTPNAERVWGSKLNALVNLNHCKLAKVLHEIKREGKIVKLQESLDRMDYSNAYNHETQVLSLRHKAHAKYGMITV